jgi:hypothetical protein
MKKTTSAFLLVFMGTANALTVGEYESMKEKNPRDVCSYLSGLSNGFYWSEAMELKSPIELSKLCIAY